jgi:hypothetical protein
VTKSGFSCDLPGLAALNFEAAQSTLQPLVDRLADRLPAWKGRLLHRSGWLTLIKTTLCVGPIYTMISIGLPGLLIKALSKIMRSFPWGAPKSSRMASALSHG